jgi:hypothetical protein
METFQGPEYTHAGVGVVALAVPVFGTSVCPKGNCQKHHNGLGETHAC